MYRVAAAGRSFDDCAAAEETNPSKGRAAVDCTTAKSKLPMRPGRASAGRFECRQGSVSVAGRATCGTIA
jgi:hypothetical protein